MSTQQYVPQRRPRTATDRVGALAARLYGSDTAQDADASSALVERLEQRLRTSRLGWWLRRYGAVYPRLAALGDVDVAQIVGVCWLAYLVITAIASVLAGPWVVVLALPFGALLLLATVLVVLWWMGYRRSGRQLRHQMLARDGFARGREVAEHVGALKVVEEVATVRPVAAESMRTIGRAGTLHRQCLGQLGVASPASAALPVRRPVVAAAVAVSSGGARASWPE